MGFGPTLKLNPKTAALPYVFLRSVSFGMTWCTALGTINAQIKEITMTYMKMFACSLLLFPAMAIAQPAAAETYYQPGQPVPGEDDHPAHSGQASGGDSPAEPYYLKDQPVPGSDDHPGITGKMEGTEPVGDYYDRGQPIPGASDHPSLAD